MANTQTHHVPSSLEASLGQRSAAGSRALRRGEDGVNQPVSSSWGIMNSLKFSSGARLAPLDSLCVSGQYVIRQLWGFFLKTHLYLPTGGMFSPSITEVRVFFKWQNSTKTYTSCKKRLEEKFRGSICRAFDSVLCSPLRPRLCFVLEEQRGWLRVRREALGCRPGRGWLEEERERSFSVQPPHVQECEPLSCIDSPADILCSHRHSGEQDPALSASSRDTPRNTKQKSPGDRCR